MVSTLDCLVIPWEAMEPWFLVCGIQTAFNRYQQSLRFAIPANAPGVKKRLVIFWAPSLKHNSYGGSGTPFPY